VAGLGFSGHGTLTRNLIQPAMMNPAPIPGNSRLWRDRSDSQVHRGGLPLPPLPLLVARSLLPVMAAVLCLLSILQADAQHTHAQISFSSGEWRLFVYDFDSGKSDPAFTPFVFGRAAMQFVPGGPFTNILGAAGSAVWTLPENSDPELVYLGISSSGIPSGTFLNNQIRLELHTITGPGDFALYNPDALGRPVAHMNTRDGIDPSRDSISFPAVGGHVHSNWSFIAPGVYRLGFAASGRLASNGSRVTSSVVEFTFVVEDVPWRPHLTLSRSMSDPRLKLVVRSAAGRGCLLEGFLGGAGWTPLTNFVFSADNQSFGLPAVNPLGLYRARIVPP